MSTKRVFSASEVDAMLASYSALVDEAHRWLDERGAGEDAMLDALRERGYSVSREPEADEDNGETAWLRAVSLKNEGDKP